MNYQEFLDQILSLVRLNVPKNTEVERTSVIKNNDTQYDALTFRKENCPLSPTIYLNRFYQDYLAGEDPMDIAKKVVSVFESADLKEEPDISSFSDFEQIKSRIMFKLVNYERNRLLLKDTPYYRYLDLAVVFYCLLCEGSQASATVLIKKHHLDYWGKTMGEIKEIAQTNTPRFLCAEITALSELLSSFPVEADNGLFVLSNRLKQNGASCILYQNVLEEFSERMQSDLFVLPSSIHEVLLLPADDRREAGHLSELVREVNRSQVLAEEYLSDHVYYYSREERRLYA